MERVDTPKQTNPKPRGRKHHVGQCDFKLAYISLWWKQMERDGMKEKQDETLDKRVLIALMMKKKNLNMKNLAPRNIHI